MKGLKAAYPKYRVALMRSGLGSCRDLTAALLTNNKA